MLEKFAKEQAVKEVIIDGLKDEARYSPPTFDKSGELENGLFLFPFLTILLFAIFVFTKTYDLNIPLTIGFGVLLFILVYVSYYLVKLNYKKKMVNKKDEIFEDIVENYINSYDVVNGFDAKHLNRYVVNQYKKFFSRVYILQFLVLWGVFSFLLIPVMSFLNTQINLDTLKNDYHIQDKYIEKINHPIKQSIGLQMNPLLLLESIDESKNNETIDITKQKKEPTKLTISLDKVKYLKAFENSDVYNNNKDLFDKCGYYNDELTYIPNTDRMISSCEQLYTNIVVAKILGKTTINTPKKVEWEELNRMVEYLELDITFPLKNNSFNY